MSSDLFVDKIKESKEGQERQANYTIREESLVSQTLYSSILFLASAAIWAVLAFIYPDFRILNITLFVVFLILGLRRRKQYQFEKRYMDEDD
ncbi:MULTISPECIES: hypothetical protein [Thalassobacillus]|uniref:hypothetical protein n=1 Tax=Thalassobacillus TaxID=331971 RepID=UPI000A1C9388|nr:hypothetical protein [Thalassobacillus devorans]